MNSPRLRPDCRVRAPRLLAVAILLVALAAVAEAGWLRPVVGEGNFRFVCDVVTLPAGAGGHDVVAMVAIEHRELTFEDEAGRQRARVRATLTITAPDGRTAELETTVRLVARDREDALSGTLRQEFPLVLHGVPFPSGQLSLLLEDLNRRRPGFVHLGTGHRAQALASADWYAPPARAAQGLSVGDAVYLAHAPIRTWETDGRLVSPGSGGGPWGYINPLRRYGLEAEALQIYFTLEPPVLIEDRARAASRPIRLEVTSDHLDFALVDTMALTDPARRALQAGQPVAVYWEMDAGGLPPGSFRLGIAPLDTVGRGLLGGFDVVWSLQQVARPVDRLLGEGRTVFAGDRLDEFEAAPRVEQELMLDEFWAELDPTPEDPYNEVHAEFLRRMAHVETYFGGIGERGPVDPRGHVYLLLGPPDAIREEVMPVNENALEDARVQVYERYAPVREGEFMRGGVQGNPGDQTGIFSGPMPMPYSYMGEKDIRANKTGADSGRFQLWSYDDRGDQLFLNPYSGAGGGLRFLFVDKRGLGRYVLDSDNVRLEGD
jgi:GWxTD domain-containing protein